jgi:hypothetical protein
MRCKFNPRLKCRDIMKKCETCEVRTEAGQRLLVPEPQKINRITEMKDLKVTCPYCLFTGNIAQFQIKVKKGFSEKRFKCPDCGEGMLRNTLINEMGVEEFADWVLDNVPFGFWKRAKAGVFMKRLKDMGIANEFWSHYKKRKQERGGKTYFDYLEEQQEEARKRWEEEEAKEQQEYG